MPITSETLPKSGYSADTPKRYLLNAGALVRNLTWDSTDNKWTYDPLGATSGGSKLTMKYPACILKGEGARGLTLSIALAGKGQHQDAGEKMIHLAPNTSSTIISKSVSRRGGNVTYKGLVEHGKNAD